MTTVILALFALSALAWACMVHYAFLVVRREVQRLQAALDAAERKAAHRQEILNILRAQNDRLREEHEELIDASYRAAHRERQLVDALRARTVLPGREAVGWSAEWVN